MIRESTRTEATGMWTAITRWLLGLAAVLLLATAGFHATGFGAVAGMPDRGGPGAGGDTTR
jgi:hypothetical protein